MINGVSDLCITKLDVLNAFEEIKWVDSYTLKNNLTTEEWPFDLQQIKQVNESGVNGWLQSLENCKSPDQLPEQVKSFIKILEKKSGIPLSYLSTGPGREELICF